MSFYQDRQAETSSKPLLSSANGASTSVVASSAVSSFSKAVLLDNLPGSIREALSCAKNSSNTATDTAAKAGGKAQSKLVCTINRVEHERALRRHYQNMRWAWDGGNRLGFEFGTSGLSGSDRGRTRGRYVKVVKPASTQP